MQHFAVGSSLLITLDTHCHVMSNMIFIVIIEVMDRGKKLFNGP